MKIKLLANLFRAGKTLTTGAASGMVKPLPLSGIVNEVGSAVKEIKEQNNYTRLIKLGAYMVMGGALYYVIAKGLMTFEQVRDIVELINDAIEGNKID